MKNTATIISPPSKARVLSPASRAKITGLPPGLAGAEAIWKATSYREGDAVLPDLTGHGHDLDVQLGTTNEPKFLSYAGMQYAYLPGVDGNFFSTPDSAALSITGDIDIRAAMAMDEWVQGSFKRIVSKFLSTGDNREWTFDLVPTSGNIRFVWDQDGTSGDTNVAESTVAPTVDNGDLLLVRTTLDVDDGATNHAVTFYTKTSTEADARADLLDDTGWTQLGDVITGTGVTSIFDGAAPVTVGSLSADSSGRSVSGKVYAAVIKDGIAGTTVASPDFTDPDQWSEPFSTGDDAQGNTWSANRSSSGRKLTFVPFPLFLHGTDDLSEASDAAGLDFGDGAALSLTARFGVHGTPGSSQVICGKKADLTTGAGYALYLNTNREVVGIVADGSTSTTVTSSVLADGEAHEVTLIRDGSDVWLVVNGTATAKVADGTGDLSNAVAFRVGATSAGASFLDGIWTASGVHREALSDADATSAQEALAAA